MRWYEPLPTWREPGRGPLGFLWMATVLMMVPLAVYAWEAHRQDLAEEERLRHERVVEEVIGGCFERCQELPWSDEPGAGYRACLNGCYWDAQEMLRAGVGSLAGYGDHQRQCYDWCRYEDESDAGVFDECVVTWCDVPDVDGGS